MIDVCIPLGTGSKADDFELRICLRAWEQNFAELGRVFICGHYPAWLKCVEHLDVPDSDRHDKDANLVRKLLAACEAGISKQFVRCSDDEFLMLPSTAADLKPYHAGDLANRVGSKTYWDGGWKLRLRATGHWLRLRNKPTLHYDTHLPKLYDRDLFVQIMRDFPRDAYEHARPKRGKWTRLPKKVGFTIDTMYCNMSGYVNPPQLTTELLALTDGSAKWNVAKIYRKLDGKRYVNCNDTGLTDAEKQVLSELFPNPSRFEKV